MKKKMEGSAKNKRGEREQGREEMQRTYIKFGNYWAQHKNANITAYTSRYESKIKV